MGREHKCHSTWEARSFTIATTFHVPLATLGGLSKKSLELDFNGRIKLEWLLRDGPTKLHGYSHTSTPPQTDTAELREIMDVELTRLGGDGIYHRSAVQQYSPIHMPFPPCSRKEANPQQQDSMTDGQVTPVLLSLTAGKECAHRQLPEYLMP